MGLDERLDFRNVDRRGNGAVFSQRTPLGGSAGHRHSLHLLPVEQHAADGAATLTLSPSRGTREPRTRKRREADEAACFSASHFCFLSSRIHFILSRTFPFSLRISSKHTCQKGRHAQAGWRHGCATRDTREERWLVRQAVPGTRCLQGKVASSLALLAVPIKSLRTSSPRRDCFHRVFEVSQETCRAGRLLLHRAGCGAGASVPSARFLSLGSGLPSLRLPRALRKCPKFMIV